MQKQEWINCSFWWSAICGRKMRKGSFYSLPFPSSHSHSHKTSSVIPIPMGIPWDPRDPWEFPIHSSLVHTSAEHRNTLEAQTAQTVESVCCTLIPADKRTRHCGCVHNIMKGVGYNTPYTRRITHSRQCCNPYVRCWLFSFSFFFTISV